MVAIKKKPTKAHKSKKVVKAHQGFAADGSRATAEQSKPKSKSVSVGKPQKPRVTKPSQAALDQVRRVGKPSQAALDQVRRFGKPNTTARQIRDTLIPGFLAEPQMADQQMGQLLRRNKGVAPSPSQPRATLVKEPTRALPKPMDENDGRGQPSKSGNTPIWAKSATSKLKDQFRSKSVRQKRKAPAPNVRRPQLAVEPPRAIKPATEPTRSVINKPVYEEPNRGQRIINRTQTRPEVVSARMSAPSVGPRVRKAPSPMSPILVNRGGYISRAIYGIVDNLKKKK
jgi:hypothetical protein